MFTIRPEPFAIRSPGSPHLHGRNVPTMFSSRMLRNSSAGYSWHGVSIGPVPPAAVHENVNTAERLECLGDQGLGVVLGRHIASHPDDAAFCRGAVQLADGGVDGPLVASSNDDRCALARHQLPNQAPDSLRSPRDDRDAPFQLTLPGVGRCWRSGGGCVWRHSCCPYGSRLLRSGLRIARGDASIAPSSSARRSDEPHRSRAAARRH